MLDDWPFGEVMCCLVPFVQVVSVYVSSFTMAAIALDRYQVIIRPLRPRMGATHGALIIAVIWVMAALLALPYAIYNQVVEVFTYRRLVRCQPRYPPPALVFRRWLTLATFLTQYALPLALTLLAYAAVVRRVWWGAVVGVSTRQQATLRIRAKKKTVKMLMVVVILFALCWLPLNTYHLVVDFSSPVGSSRHSSSVFFLCHWFAMSSVCYNPFIYCWLNDHFRAGAKSLFTCAGRRIAKMLGCATRRRSCQGCMDDEADADLQNFGGFVGNTSRDGLAPMRADTTHQSNSGETATSSSSSSAITCVPFSSGWKGGGGSSILKKDNKREGTKPRSVSFRKQVNFGSNKKVDYLKTAKSHALNIPMRKIMTGGSKSKCNAESTPKSISIFKQKCFRGERNPAKSFPTLSTCSSSFNKKDVSYLSGSGVSGRGLSRNRGDLRSSGNIHRPHQDLGDPMRDGSACYLDTYSGCLFRSPADVKGQHVYFRSSLLPENCHSSLSIGESEAVGHHRDRERLFSLDNLHLRNESPVQTEDAKMNVDFLNCSGSHCNDQTRNLLRYNSMDGIRARSYNPSESYDVITSKKRVVYGSLINKPHTQETVFRSPSLEDCSCSPSDRNGQELSLKRENIHYKKNAFPENSAGNLRHCPFEHCPSPYISTWDDHQTKSLGSNCICSTARDANDAYCSMECPRDYTSGRRHSMPTESTNCVNYVEHPNWSTVNGDNFLFTGRSTNSDLPNTGSRCYSVDYLNDF